MDNGSQIDIEVPNEIISFAIEEANILELRKLLAEAEKLYF